MFCVEVEENKFDLFINEEASRDRRAEIANDRAEGGGKEVWIAAYDEIYTEWVGKCHACCSGYVLPNGLCNYCNVQHV